VSYNRSFSTANERSNSNVVVVEPERRLAELEIGSVDGIPTSCLVVVIVVIVVDGVVVDGVVVVVTVVAVIYDSVNRSGSASTGQRIHNKLGNYKKFVVDSLVEVAADDDCELGAGLVDTQAALDGDELVGALCAAADVDCVSSLISGRLLPPDVKTIDSDVRFLIFPTVNESKANLHVNFSESWNVTHVPR